MGLALDHTFPSFLWLTHVGLLLRLDSLVIGLVGVEGGSNGLISFPGMTGADCPLRLLIVLFLIMFLMFFAFAERPRRMALGLYETCAYILRE